MISVDEESILESSCQQLLTACSNKNIYKTMYVTFQRQEGLDAGALTTSFIRKFFEQVIERKLLEQGTSCFHVCEDNFSNHLFHSKETNVLIFKSIGVMLALCLYLRRSVGNVKFSNTLLNFLLKSNNNSFCASFIELEQFDMKLYIDLNEMILVDDLSIYCLDFSGLKPEGEKFELAKENLQEFISLTVNQKMINSRKQNLNLIQQGFYEMSELLDQFKKLNANDIHILITCEQVVDIPSIVQHCILFLDNQPTMEEWMREVLLSLSQNEFKQFLLFCTSYCSTQSQRKLFENGNLSSGFARDKINVRIMKDCESDRLPQSQVCFYLLNIPLYETKQQLEQKLKQAISYTNDFFANG